MTVFIVVDRYKAQTEIKGVFYTFEVADAYAASIGLSAEVIETTVLTNAVGLPRSTDWWN